MTDEKTNKRAFARGKKHKIKSKIFFIRQVILSLVSVLESFLFSGTAFPFSTYPLGVALICSAEKHLIEYTIGIFLRIALSRSREKLYLPAVLCVSAAAFRYVMLITQNKRENGLFPRDDIFEKLSFNDDIKVRVFSSLCASFISAAVGVLSGRTVYDVFAGSFGIITTVLFTFLFAFAQRPRLKSTAIYAAGKAAIVFCVVFSFAGASVMTISLGTVAAYAIMLTMAFSGDGAKGCVSGLLSGLAAGADNAVLFAFSGLAAGVFYEVSPLVASLISLGVTVCGGLYSSGTVGLSAILPEVLIAAILVLTAKKLDILPNISFGGEDMGGKLRISTLLAKKREEEKENRAEQHADMLSSLSKTIKNMSVVFRSPDRGRISDVCRAAFEKHCENCPSKGECQRTKESEEDLVDSIAFRIMKKGKTVSGTGILRFGCVKKEVIISDINAGITALLRESALHDKTRIFAFDYGAAAKIIADTVAKSDKAYEIDRTLTEKLCRAFELAGIYAENVVVCGGRKKYIIATGRDILRSGFGAQDVRDLCVSVCGGSFTMPEYSIEGEEASMTLESTRIFEVEHAERQSAKRGERVCGDAVGCTESRDDLFYGFICDGMGSGSEADITAGICKTFLEQMLSCGNRKSTTLEMLNMFISNKNTECFSTIDLLEIDLLRGVASFTKSGAAASYIVRKGSVYKIASGTVPLGILSEVSAEVTEFSLRDGDVIVMCSDGVGGDGTTEADKRDLHLLEFLEHEWRMDACDMAENILSDAAYINKRSDDMSVCVYRIRQKN